MRAPLAGLGLLVATGCLDEPRRLARFDHGPPLEHGFVKLQLVRAENEERTPFDSTNQITATMHYGDCLRDFYEAAPELGATGYLGWRVFGPREDGGEGWRDRLCEGFEGDRIACRVTRIAQDLDEAKLSVTYELLEGDIETRFLKFGPLPAPDFADCDGEARPSVEVRDSVPVRGFDRRGVTLWETVETEPNVAATGQGPSLVGRVARLP